MSRRLVFVRAPEKIDSRQLRQDLEKFGRNLRLKIYYLYEPTTSFSETLPFRPPSNWTQLIRDTQLALSLIEVEDELMKINKDGKIFPNLSMENVVHYKIK